MNTERWSQEIRYAARRLVRAPVSTALVVATLGIGVGAFAAVWAVVDGVLLEPMPYEEPEELAWVWRDYPWLDLSQGFLGGPDIVGMRESEAFESVAALRNERTALASRGGDAPREVRMLLTSATFFDLLGVEPALGRGFASGEDEPGAAPVAVLGHDLWVTAYGGDPSVVGSEVLLDGVPTTVVGVLPEGFDFVVPASLGSPVPADVYAPLQWDLGSLNPYSGSLVGLVRTAEGAGPAEVEAALARIADRVDEGWEVGELRLWDVPMREELVEEVRPALIAIVSAAGFLLLVLGANLATLLLARAAARERETAVRSALGASRGSVAGSIVAEALLLAIAGGALAVVLGSWGAELLGLAASDTLPRAGEVGLDGDAMLLTGALAVALGLLAALGPAGWLLGIRTSSALREGGPRAGTSRGHVRIRGALVAAQVALSVVLLVGAGLLARSLGGLLAADPGFDPGRALTFRVSLDGATYPDDAAALSFTDLLLERLHALPGVEAAAVGDALPLTADASQGAVPFLDVAGRPEVAGPEAPFVDRLRVSPGFFEAAGLRMVEGRSFREGEWEAGSRSVVIDDVLARRMGSDGSVLGGRVVVGVDTATVVGVVDQARQYDVHRDDRPQVYIPWAWNPDDAPLVVLRTSGDPTALLEPARAAVHAVDPRVPVSEVRELGEIAAAALGDDRRNLALVGVFALAALILASLGIYGVVANAVVRRRPEIGIRMALGAEPAGVVSLVVRQGLRPVVVGALLGLAGAVVVSRFLSSLLFDVAPLDPLTYGAVIAVLAAVAALAAWVPASKAARVQPLEALRAA